MTHTVIEISNSLVKSDPEVWLPTMLLYHSDRRILVSRTEWLNDSIIHAAQMLLQKQSKDIHGWRHSLCSKREALFPLIPLNTKFVQLLNVNENHWICVSNVITGDTLKNCVRVYDSALGNVGLDTKKAVCSILRPKESVLHFDLVNVQQQLNSWDCGLFAVAFATELVHERSPSCRHFDVKLFRPHLLDCLKEGTLSCFPSKSRRVGFGRIVKRSAMETIYCICRMVNDPLCPMIQCGTCTKWFHFNCVGLADDNSTKHLKWHCATCKNLFHV